jgi:hypothetical protein
VWLLGGLSLGLAACSSATPAPAPKTAAAELPVVSVAASAPAAPLVPVIAPDAPPEMPGLTQRLAAMIDGSRPTVTPFTIDVMSLPQAALPAPLDAKTAAKLDRSKLTADTTLTVRPADGYSRQYMVHFSFAEPSKVSFGRVRVAGTYGQSEGWFGLGYGATMTAYQTCGRAADLVPLHWETVKIEADKLTYTVTEGVLDRASCSVLSYKTATATAKPLLPRGILFGFRSCEDTCPDNEELTLIFPRASASSAGALGGGAERSVGSFSLVSFPIQRGGGGAFLARLTKRDVVDWQLAGAVKETDKATPGTDDQTRLGQMFLTSFNLGVEVSQARDDEEPIAIAYVDIDPASLPVPLSTPAAASTGAAPTLANPFGSRIGFDNSFELLNDRR